MSTKQLFKVVRTNEKGIKSICQYWYKREDDTYSYTTALLADEADELIEELSARFPTMLYEKVEI